MGSAFSFTAIAATEAYAQAAVDSALHEVFRIEELISSWNDSSETSLVNRNAGKDTTFISQELFQLIERCIKVSRLTGGAFDISYASMDKVWDFKKTYETIPSEDAIASSVAKIDFNKIWLNRDLYAIYLPEEGMKIGFGAIGKGYAANRAKYKMMSAGAHSGVVNAGGDLITWGNKLNGKTWSVGIADPFKRDTVKMWLEITDMAVVTSGDYERFIMIQNERYGHIIDPRSGWPVKGIRSVTIICPDAEVADALATSVFVLGVQDGLGIINQVEGVECLIIDEENEMHYSTNLHLQFFKMEE